MSDETRAKLAEARSLLDAVCEEVFAAAPCRAFAALRRNGDGESLVLSGNSEGLTYFASVLVGLAIDANPGQHFHFGEGEMLDVADCQLVVRFEAAEWDAGRPNPLSSPADG